MAHISNLEQTVALDMEKWLQTLPEEAPAYAFSEKYKKFRIKLFDKMRGEKYHRFTKRATVAIIVAAILFAMAVATLAATLGKEFIIKHFNGFAEVSVSESDEVKGLTDFSIAYIPQGFELSEKEQIDIEIKQSYVNGSQWFDVFKRTIDLELNYDEESESIKKVTLNGVTYIIGPSDGSNDIMWNDGNYIYEINGTLSVDELIKIAESIV